MWLFAVDVGDGLPVEDCEAITRFRRNGGGFMVTRDHMDLGSSVCNLGGVGKAHHFHSRNPNPDETNRTIDDPYLRKIYPGRIFSSGANGDFQEIDVVRPVHPVLVDRTSATGAIRYLPSHPHEGGVSAPEERIRPCDRNRVPATSPDINFNIAVAFEPGANRRPAIAQSTFYHFADYNWDTAAGCPSFVDELHGDAIMRTQEAIEEQASLHPQRRPLARTA